MTVWSLPLKARLGCGIVCLLGLLPTAALAATYKCTDAGGKVSYSEKAESGKRCVEMTFPAQQVGSPLAQPRRSPGEGDGERAPKHNQREALEKKMAELQKALADARKKLADQEAVRYGNEQNYQRVLDRLKPFQDEVTRLEESIKQLRQEMDNPAPVVR